jgi:hypothetical protein
MKLKFGLPSGTLDNGTVLPPLPVNVNFERITAVPAAPKPVPFFFCLILQKNVKQIC